MPLTEAQREERRQGIGGSDAAALVGRHPSVTPLALWLDKVHGVERTDSDGEWVEWGNLLEPTIQQEAARRLGEVVSVPTATVRHRDEPRMLANVDGLLSGGRVLECKNVSDLSWRTTDEEERTDGAYRHHWWQVQHYMEVLDAPGAVVAYLIGGAKLELIEVKRSPAIGRYLREQIGAWWQRHVIEGIPPEEGTPDERVSMLERLHRKASKDMLPTQDPDLIALAKAYCDAKGRITVGEADAAEAKAVLCAAIGSARGLDFGEHGKVTWSTSKQGKRTFRVTLRDAEDTE